MVLADGRGDLSAIGKPVASSARAPLNRMLENARSASTIPGGTSLELCSGEVVVHAGVFAPDLWDSWRCS